MKFKAQKAFYDKKLGFVSKDQEIDLAEKVAAPLVKAKLVEKA